MKNYNNTKMNNTAEFKANGLAHHTSLKNEKFISSLKKLFEPFITKNGIDYDGLEKVLSAQGASLSIEHNVKVPFVENIFSPNQENNPNSFDFSKAANLMGKGTLYMFNTNFWLNMYFFLSLGRLTTYREFNTNNVHTRLTQLSYTALTMLIVSVTIHEIASFTGFSSEPPMCMQFYEEIIKPTWEELENTLDNELQMEDIIKPQGMSDYLPKATLALTGIIFAMTGHKPKNPFIESLIGITKINTTQSTNIMSIIKYLSNAVSKLFESVGASTLSTFFEVEIIQFEDVENWVNTCENFLASVSAGTTYTSAFYTSVYADLLKKGETIVKAIDKSTYDYTIVNQYLKKLHECKLRIDTLKLSLSGTRIEPVAVLLQGLPGCFKTVLMSRLRHMVTAITLPEPWLDDFERNPQSFNFSLPTDKFFDRYDYKKWTVEADDLFQASDHNATIMDSEPLKIISIVNSSEYCLPMSDIKDKNSMYFRSPFLFATTNLTNYAQIVSIQSAGALERRFFVTLDVSLNPKYLDHEGNLITSLLPSTKDDEEWDAQPMGNSTYLPDDIWRINMTLINSTTYETFMNVSLEQVVKAIVNRHQKNIKNYYVNQHCELKMQKRDARSLRQQFATDKFSCLQQKSMFPIKPQSGSETEYFEFYHPLSFFLQNMTPSDYQALNMEYYNVLYEKQIPDFFHLRPDSMTVIFDSLTETEKTTIGALLVDKDIHGFCVNLVAKILTRYMSRRDLYTGIKPTKAEEASAAIRVSLNRITRTITKFLDDNKLLLGIFGMCFAGLSFWLYKASKEVSTTITAQSADLTRDRARMGKNGIKSKEIILKDGAHNFIVNPQASSLFIPDLTGVLPDIDKESLGRVSNQNDVLQKIVKKYFFLVYVVVQNGNETKHVRFGHAWNLKGQVFVMPFHFLYKFQTIMKRKGYVGAEMVLTTSTKSLMFRMSLESVFDSFKISDDSARNDCCLFTVPTAHKNSIGISKYLLTVEDLERLKKTSSFSATVFGSYISNSGGATLLRFSHTYARHFSDIAVGADWDGPDACYRIEDTFSYEGSFSNGDCGSMLVVNNSNNMNSRFIIGMHIAGSETHGYSSLVLENYTEALVEHSFKDKYLFDSEEDPPYVISTPVSAQGNMEASGTLINTHQMSSANRSELRKSAFYGKLPGEFKKVTHFPALLHRKELEDGTIIDPGMKALNKYKKEAVFIDPVSLRYCVSSYSSLIMQHCLTLNEYRTVVPLKEALHSFRSVGNIKISSSAGFPMCLDKEESLKKLYYNSVIEENDEKINFYFERIAQLVQNRIVMYSEGVRPSIFYKDCLKDEKIPLEKVLEGKTRMFSACDFIQLVMYRQYFGAFMSDYIDANLNVGSGIGVNCYSTQWDDLARKLLRFSKTNSEECIGAGDYSGFDTSLQPIVLYHILDIINNWYGKDNIDNRIRSQMWSEIVNSRHIWENKVYDWRSGMPSGNPLTAIINTMYNQILIRLCYALIYPVSSFNDNVESVSLGDDIVFSVRENIRHNFNEMFLQANMPLFGMKYTSETKEYCKYPFRQITEVEFLKRSFRLDRENNRWVAPMRITAVFAPLNWTKKGIAANQSSVDEISSTLSELSLHGEKIFDTYASQLVNMKNTYLPTYKPAKEYSMDYNQVYYETLDLEFRLFG